MKIRFYHLWIYILFRKLWTPILVSNPKIAKDIHDYMGGWLNSQGIPTKDKLEDVDNQEVETNEEKQPHLSLVK